ncbi:hypothetical protein C4K26_1784 [Pseudomonas chlororaphis]|nr:hypothetical protein C4K26_1784 [Pseudomonas chlororaphis]
MTLDGVAESEAQFPGKTAAFSASGGIAKTAEQGFKPAWQACSILEPGRFRAAMLLSCERVF